ncbi:hypothetical protein Sjap_003364 [Stephania japonica]|uniref:RRM domain-containing protein n=1 Tax=Stephania japonica TaxID=461633 RepID=A0AAP0KQC4_9MAGN
MTSRTSSPSTGKWLNTNHSRGFGFIVFDNEQVADDLLANGNMIDMVGTRQVPCI